MVVPVELEELLRVTGDGEVPEEQKDLFADLGGVAPEELEEAQDEGGVVDEEEGVGVGARRDVCEHPAGLSADALLVVVQSE